MSEAWSNVIQKSQAINKIMEAIQFKYMKQRWYDINRERMKFSTDGENSRRVL